MQSKRRLYLLKMDKKRLIWLSLGVSILTLGCCLGARESFIYFRTFFFFPAGLILGKKWGSLSQALFLAMLFIIFPSWLPSGATFYPYIGFLLGSLCMTYWVGWGRGYNKVPPTVTFVVVVFMIFMVALVYSQSKLMHPYFIYPFIIALAAFIYYFFRMFKSRHLVQLLVSGLIINYLISTLFSFSTQLKSPWFQPFIRVYLNLVPGDFLSILVIAFIIPPMVPLLIKKKVMKEEQIFRAMQNSIKG